MNVYAISDTHGQLPPIPQDADLILHAGDICPDGDRSSPCDGVGQQSNWLDTTFREWLETAPCEVVGIAGNHDFVFETGLVPDDLPWTYLRDAETVAAGLRVWGTPWVPGLPYWAFYGSDVALEARASIIPSGLDVLLSHGPPYRAGDYIPTSENQRNKYGNFGGMNVGDKALRARIAEAKPIITVCGHIHEDRGYHYVPAALDDPDGSFSVVNVAAVDAAYVLHKNPWTYLTVLS